MLDEIEKIILSVLPDATVKVKDPRHDGVHLQAIVIDASFEGVSFLKRQKPIMSALSDSFATSLHALELKTYTPKEYQLLKKD